MKMKIKEGIVEAIKREIPDEGRLERLNQKETELYKVYLDEVVDEGAELGTDIDTAITMQTAIRVRNGLKARLPFLWETTRDRDDRAEAAAVMQREADARRARELALAKGGLSVSDLDRVDEFVYCPFPNDEQLKTEMRDHWQNYGEVAAICDDHWAMGSWNLLKRNVSKDLKVTLYILAHSNTDLMFLASSDRRDKLAPKDLAEMMGCFGVPKCIPMIKIWACFSGVNAFAMNFQKIIAGDGYRAKVRGYNGVAGGPNDTGKQDASKHVWSLDANGKRDQVLGEASDPKFHTDYQPAPPYTR